MPVADFLVILSNARRLRPVYTSEPPACMIAIITYDAPHRKTQDVVTKLVLNGYSGLHLVVLPWVERKSFQPMFSHRPSGRVEVGVEDLCKRLGIRYSKVGTDGLNTFFSAGSFNHILIAGAGILPAEVAENHRIINAHPGYLPNMKGLDALKWSIYHEQPIGVTTHYISGKADEGERIERRIIPVYFEDTFHNVAYRVYEAEIDMLVNSISLVETKVPTYESLNDDRYAPNKRMPHHFEPIMMTKFEDIRKRSRSNFC